jgi:hypothetical protein
VHALEGNVSEVVSEFRRQSANVPVDIAELVVATISDTGPPDKK